MLVHSTCRNWLILMANSNNEILYEEFEKIAGNNFPPDMQLKLLSNISEWKTKDNKSLSILVTGKTGSGKSTLINGILGLPRCDNNAVREDDINTYSTTKLKPYHTIENDVSITVWDSPGLQDGTSHQNGYLKQLNDKCSDVDLVMYCVSIKDTRFVLGSDNPDFVAMRKLTEIFGPEFWQKVVIILTYANIIEMLSPHWKKLEDEERNKAFNEKIQEWESQIKKMFKHICIPNEIIDNVKVVPAGHVVLPHLPGIKYWLSNLWLQCLFTISSPEARCALVQINLARIKKAADVKEEDFDIEQVAKQPIVIDSMMMRNMVRGFSGAAIGGVIGGILGGPIGAAIGVGIGALLGGGGGGGIGKLKAL